MKKFRTNIAIAIIFLMASISFSSCNWSNGYYDDSFYCPSVELTLYNESYRSIFYSWDGFTYYPIAPYDDITELLGSMDIDMHYPERIYLYISAHGNERRIGINIDDCYKTVYLQ